MTMARVIDEGDAGLDYRCSFCLRWDSDVEIMVAGVGGNICDECVDLAVDVTCKKRDEMRDSLKATARTIGWEWPIP